MRGLVAALLLVVCSDAACSAEIFYMDHDLLTGRFVGPVGPLVISGELDSGDYERLLARMRADRTRFLAQNKIILASNGGDVREAIKIARLLQALYTNVAVGPQTGPCVGACFLIFAAATARASDAPHLIGLHRPTLVEHLSATLSAEQAGALEARALAEVREFLAANDVPNHLLDAMFERSADHVYWLTADDERELGFLSPQLRRMLATRCAWNESLEHDAYAGRRPFRELADAQACRDRLTRDAAQKALQSVAAAGR